MNSNFIYICIIESQIILFNYPILFVISFVNFNRVFWWVANILKRVMTAFLNFKKVFKYLSFYHKHPWCFKYMVLFHILSKHRICVRWFSHCHMHFLNGNPIWKIKALNPFGVIKHKRGLIFLLLPSIYWFFSPRLRLGKTNSRE